MSIPATSCSEQNQDSAAYAVEIFYHSRQSLVFVCQFLER